MHIKGRFKLIRKYDCDFWNLMYYRASENRFFRYFNISLKYKLKQFVRKKEVTFRSKQIFRIRNLGTKVNRQYYNPFLNKLDSNLLKIRNNLNFFKLFKRRGLRFCTYIFKRCFYYKEAYSNDLLLGVKSSYRIYKPLRLNVFQRKQNFFRQITLFYNGFDNTKLRRFGKLGRKGKFGGINFFFFLLESRLDSIILRLNLACKFVVRELIKSKKILVDEKAITYLNYVVKKNSFVTFIESFKATIYYTLKKRIKTKSFFVQPPFYLEINYRTLIILIVPKLIDPSFVPYPFLKSRSSILSGLHTVLWGW